MENNQFNEKVKNKLELHIVEPSPAVWDHIQAQLDKDAAAFDNGNLKRFWWFSAAMLTVASIILVVWYSSEKINMVAYQAPTAESLNTPKKNTAENINNELVIQDNSSKTSNKVSSKVSSENQVAQEDAQIPQFKKGNQEDIAKQSGLALETSNSSEKNTDENIDATLKEESASIQGLNSSISEESLNNTEDLSAVRDELTSDISDVIESKSEIALVQSTEIAETVVSKATDEESINDDITAIEPIEKIKKTLDNPFKGFYMGLNGGYNASTLLNSQNVVINDNPIETGFRFGPSKGLTLGYIFANNLSVQAEYLYNVIEGQNYYMEDVEGAVKSKAMTLYYDQVPLVFKLQTPRYNHLMKKPASVNILAGAQLNILKDYQIPQERRYDTEEDIFSPTNFSFLAGAEYQMLIKANIMVSLGVQGTISENFSTNNDPLGDFQKHSLTTGVKGGIYYHF